MPSQVRWGTLRPTSGIASAAAAIFAAATLLGLATASGPFFVSSAGTALLEAELSSVGADQLTLLGVHASGAIDPDSIRAADTALRDELDELGLPPATQQVVVEVTAASDREVTANLIGRQGATDHLPPTVQDADGELVVPVTSAGRIGVAAGERLRLRGAGGGTVEVRVGAAVEDFDRGAMPAFWRPVTGLLTAVDDVRIPPPPPALLGEPDVVLDLLGELGGQPSDGELVHRTRATATWTVPFEGALTLEQAQALVPRVTSIRTMVVDPTTDLGGLLAAGGAPASVSGQQVDAALQRVERATAGLATPVRLLAWAGQGLAVVGIGVATVLGGRRRLSRGRLWAARGVAAPALGARWAALAAIPVLGGLALGWWLAGLGTEIAGPGGLVDPSVRSGVWRDLAVAAAIGVATVGVAVTLASASAAREPGARSRVPPVAEVIAVTAAGIALWQVDHRGTAVTVDTDGVLRLDALTVALPLLVVVAVAGVGTRLLGLALRHGLGRHARRGAWYVAARRLRSISGATLGLVAVTAAATGLLVVATTLAASAEATIDEQVGVLVGGDAVLPLSRAEGVGGSLTADAIGLPATRVRRAPESWFADREVDVLAIDPATFPRVAFHPRRMGEVDVAGLVDRLAGADPAGPTAAIAVGSLPRTGTLTVGGVEFEVEQVGAAPVFPGVSGARPALVVPDGGPLTPDDAAVAARMAISVYPELWVAGGDLDLAELRLHLDQVTLPSSGVGPGATGPREFVFADDLRDDPGLAPARWTFTYLLAQASLVAGLAILALLVHHRARRRAQALASALAARMGLGRRARTLADVAELGILATTAVVLGLGAGLAGARVVLTEYDPLPEVALPAVFAPPERFAPLMLLGVLALVGVTSVATRRAVETADVASLLRGSG